MSICICTHRETMHRRANELYGFACDQCSCNQYREVERKMTVFLDEKCECGHLHKDHAEIVANNCSLCDCQKFRIREDDVHHPDHYNVGKIEVIAIIEDWNLNFSEGNVLKYMMRAAHKDDPLGDLKKARWYLDRLISTQEKIVIDNVEVKK